MIGANKSSVRSEVGSCESDVPSITTHSINSCEHFDSIVHQKKISSYPPIAPSKTASDCLAAERVSAGNGRPVESKAAPPTSISWKSNSIPNI